MLKLSMNHLFNLMECGTMTVERVDGTPSTLIELSAHPQGHVLKAMSGKVFTVMGRKGVDLTLNPEAADG